MTDGNPRPDEELAPPASSRRSDETTEPDDELAPPFVPGAAPEAAPDRTPEDADEPEAPETAAEPAVPAEAERTEETEEGEYPFETGWDEPAEPIPAGVESDEDDFPFDAFDLEDEALEDVEGAAEDDETGAPGAPGSEPAPEESFVLPEGEGAVAAPVAGPADEVADQLEAMAERLRESGASAAEEQMGAPDRFTALLAGLVAGYLSGRE